MSNENNNNAIGKEKPSLVEPPKPQTPLTKVVSKTSPPKMATATKTSSEKEKEKETITIPKADFDKLVIQLDTYKTRCNDLSARLDRIGGVLIQVQGSVYNAKNVIPVSSQ